MTMPVDGEKKPQRYIRIVELLPKPGEAHRGYQPEIIFVQDDKIVHRKLVDKPNLFEFAYAIAGDLIDPRNESERHE